MPSEAASADDRMIGPPVLGLSPVTSTGFHTPIQNPSQSVAAGRDQQYHKLCGRALVDSVRPIASRLWQHHDGVGKFVGIVAFPGWKPLGQDIGAKTDRGGETCRR